MLTVTVRGAREATRYLTDVADRVLDAHAVFSDAADTVLNYEREWWLTNPWDGPSVATRARDARSGRDPRMMVDTGGLMSAATRRGASGQRLRVGPDRMLLEVTHPLARLHWKRGRGVLGDLPGREIDRIAEHLGHFLLTGAR